MSDTLTYRGIASEAVFTVPPVVGGFFTLLLLLLLLLMMVCSVNRRVSALLQQSCSILTEERLLPDSGYLSTAQDIQNVVEYESSNCQDSGSVSHRRGAASSRHTYCICFCYSVASVVYLSVQNVLWLYDAS